MDGRKELFRSGRSVLLCPRWFGRPRTHSNGLR